MPRSRNLPEDPGDPGGDESLVSRGDGRRKEREIEESLARLAKELTEARPRWLEQLDLPERVLDTVLDARAIRSHAAQNRQLRLVRAALRDEDWSLIRARLDALAKHGAIPARLASREPDAASRAPEWVARLLGEGSQGLEALIEAAPTADRTHLRSLVRQVHHSRAERRKKAEERLTSAIKSLLR